MKRILVLFCIFISINACIADDNDDGYQSGYYGVLPSIEKEFAYKKQNKAKSPVDAFKDEIPDPGQLQEAPLGDALFLDVILKKQKNSKFASDMMRAKEALENLRRCVNENCSIQQFNANVNIVDLYTKRIEKLYSGTSDGRTKSYYSLLNVNYLAKLQGNLKYDANYYAKYMPLTNTIYSKENVRQKDAELLKELDNTIFILRQLE